MALPEALKQGYTDMGYLRSDPALNSIRERNETFNCYLDLAQSLARRVNATQFPPKLFLHPGTVIG